MSIQIQYGNTSIAQCSTDIPAEHLPLNETNYTPIAGDNYVIGETVYMVQHLPTDGEILDTLRDEGIVSDADGMDTGDMYSLYLQNVDAQDIYSTLDISYSLPTTVKCEVVAAGFGDDAELVLLAFSPSVSTELCEVVGEGDDCHIVVNKTLLGSSVTARPGDLLYNQNGLSRYAVFNNHQWCVDTAVKINNLISSLPFDVDVYEKTEYAANLYQYRFSNGYSIRETADEVVGGLEVLNPSGQCIDTYSNGSSEIYGSDMLDCLNTISIRSAVLEELDALLDVAV